METQHKHFNHQRFIGLGLVLILFFSCAVPHRRGYNRNIGTWPASKYTQSKHKIAQKPKRNAPDAAPRTSTKTKPKAHTQKPPVEQASLPSETPQIAQKPTSSSASAGLKEAIKPWLGTPYLFGGESKRGTDCSGFVRQIFKAHYQIDLPHSTKEAYTFGTSIPRDELQPGDVVFFGNFLRVNHNGIYVGNNNFAHASSSKGVIYTSLDNEYWANRYKGARRY